MLRGLALSNLTSTTKLFLQGELFRKALLRDTPEKVTTAKHGHESLPCLVQNTMCCLAMLPAQHVRLPVSVK